MCAMLSPSPPNSLPSARLLIVEDHPLYRDGLLSMLQRSAPQLQCRLAERTEQALAMLRVRAAECRQPR